MHAKYLKRIRKYQQYSVRKTEKRQKSFSFENEQGFIKYFGCDTLSKFTEQNRILYTMSLQTCLTLYPRLGSVFTYMQGVGGYYHIVNQEGGFSYKKCTAPYHFYSSNPDFRISNNLEHRENIGIHTEYSTKKLVDVS